MEYAPWKSGARNMKIWPAHHKFSLRIMAATKTSFGDRKTLEIVRLRARRENAIVNKEVDTFIKDSLIGASQSQASTLHQNQVWCMHQSWFW